MLNVHVDGAPKCYCICGTFSCEKVLKTLVPSVTDLHCTRVYFWGVYRVKKNYKANGLDWNNSH